MMSDNLSPFRTCPVCGTVVERETQVCPTCNTSMSLVDEEAECPACGARTSEARCPVCGAAMQDDDPVMSARRWTAITVVLAAAALLVAAWLIRPWEDMDTSSVVAASLAERYGDIPDPSPTQTPTTTPTSTPTRTPTPTNTATPTPEFVRYSVVRGDTASQIAERYGISTETLLDFNGLSDDDILSLGQELLVPSSDAVTEDVGSPVEETPSPEAQSTPVATATPSEIVHTIVAGEHLGILSQRYGLDQEIIAAANGIGVDDILGIGQQLVIPVPASAVGGTTEELPTATLAPTAPRESREERVHIVQPGEYLGKIALLYGMDEKEIARANGITTESILAIGQRLVIPGTTAEIAAAYGATPAPTQGPAASLMDSLVPSRPVPTLTPAATRYAYAKPHLLLPINGTRFEGKEASILLSWTSSGILGEYQWYRLRMWTSDPDQKEIEVFTKATSWRVPEGLYPEGDPALLFSWQVTVVERLPHSVTGDGLSLDSQIYEFVWH